MLNEPKYLLLLSIGILGFIFVIYLVWAVKRSREKSMDRAVNVAIDNMCVIMSLDENGGIMIARRTSDGEFIAQGNDWNELCENFSIRFPGKIGFFPGTDRCIEPREMLGPKQNFP
jgi:hypothetical protein